jgi:hypothetical protein
MHPDGGRVNGGREGLEVRRCGSMREYVKKKTRQSGLRERLGNTQGTLREHSGNVAHSLNIRWHRGLRERFGNIRGILHSR